MTSVETQRRAAREGALIELAPEMGTLVVTGSERRTWLNGLVTCDLAKLEAGSGAYGLAVAKNGKILAELWVLVGADQLLLATRRDKAEALRDHFDKHLIMEDAEVRDASDEIGWMFLYGPRSTDALRAALPAMGGAALGSSITWTDLGGAAVAGPLSAIPAAARASAEALGELGAIATPEGLEQIRIEEGVARFGVDFDEQNYPQEASLERLGVSFQKGCYLGQETVFMLEARGHAKKRLVRLFLNGVEPIADRAPISLPEGGAPIGEVTSRAPSPDGSGLIALGYVKYKYASPGVSLRIDGRPASITKAPPQKD